MLMKTCENAVRASAILAAVALSGGAFAAGAAGDAYTFETGTFADQAGLFGNGTIVQATYAAPAVGKPLPGTENAKVLEIAGTVTYTNLTSFTNADKASQVDFMFKVESTDELEAPSGDDVQIALAVGTNDAGAVSAPIKLWCKSASNGMAGWQTLGDFATGSWVRATIVLDYDAPGKCSVSLDGNPVLNGTSKWFYFANEAVQDYVKSLTMVGSTQIDDLVITNASLAAYVAPGGDATITPSGTSVAVTYAYMNKYGVTTNDVARNAKLGAGMTVAEKFEAGLDPRSETKFEMQSMNVASATSATVTFPGNRGASAYEVEIKNGSGTAVGSADISANTEGEGLNTATLTLPAEAELLYIKVKAK